PGPTSSHGGVGPPAPPRSRRPSRRITWPPGSGACSTASEPGLRRTDAGRGSRVAGSGWERDSHDFLRIPSFASPATRDHPQIAPLSRVRYILLISQIIVEKTVDAAEVV